jgi:hypothetical protein
VDEMKIRAILDEHTCEACRLNHGSLTNTTLRKCTSDLGCRCVAEEPKIEVEIEEKWPYLDSLKTDESSTLEDLKLFDADSQVYHETDLDEIESMLGASGGDNISISFEPDQGLPFEIGKPLPLKVEVGGLIFEGICIFRTVESADEPS